MLSRAAFGPPFSIARNFVRPSRPASSAASSAVTENRSAGTGTPCALPGCPSQCNLQSFTSFMLLQSPSVTLSSPSCQTRDTTRASVTPTRSTSQAHQKPFDYRETCLSAIYSSEVSPRTCRRHACVRVPARIYPEMSLRYASSASPKLQKAGRACKLACGG